MCRRRRAKRGAERGQPTVDGDGHALVQDVAILALEGGDLAELVELQVVGGGAGGVNLDDLEVDIVGLSHGADGRGTRVVLQWKEKCLRQRDDSTRCLRFDKLQKSRKGLTS